MGTIAKEILIKGLVQGVGFRPFIYRLAHEYNLNGTVENNNLGVKIHVEGEKNAIDCFIIELPKRIPEASHINSIEEFFCEIKKYKSFTIVKSKSVSNEVTEVSPDIAVCKNCLEDIKNQVNRFDYAFTNCTNCGPRFTIIKDLPYDRAKTSMAVFTMCVECEKEYTTILDRRFHAQPVACNNCGPHYKLHIKGEEIDDFKIILKTAVDLLESGKILAIKGLGGYHLACNPFNNDVVKDLRLKKAREAKPLALMFASIKEARKHVYISMEEEKLLLSWRRPIVLLKIKKELAPSINLGLDTIGVMLPYMPFHYLLFDELNIAALVLTSGNISDEPIIIDNNVAIRSLSHIADANISYNRDIHNRTDDSVSFIVNSKERIIRRSRSYAPSPISLNLETEGIFAAGAELVNCFGIGKSNQVILSQHIGDLKNLETLEFYKESIDRYMNLFRFKPTLVVSDMHPEYLSSKYASSLGIKQLQVQHHHAHIASCMAEHRLDEQVIGISFDGTGYGTDSYIWGSEFLICDLADFERLNHFEYIKQPGGDSANHHPWKMMLSYLQHYFGSSITEDYADFFNDLLSNEVSLVSSMIEKNINCPLSCSAGRLFDAVAALIGVCKNSSYHAEAPMRLEAAVTDDTDDFYEFEVKDSISFKKTFESMIKDVRNEVSASLISLRFHNTIVELILDMSIRLKSNYGINKVVLSGGSFQNRIILEKTENRLRNNGFEVYSQSSIPSNDGGIALGQMAIAAKRRRLNLI